MSSLKQTEKIERVLFRINLPENKISFEVNNTILLSSKSGDSKLDPLYVRNYDSSKYDNYSKLNTVKIQTSDFITFNFNNFGNMDESQSVYISFPHLAELDEFIQALWDMVNDDTIFDKKNKIRKGKDEEYIESDKFGSDKILFAVPDSISYDNSYERGVILYINSEDAFVSLDYRAVKSLYYVLSEIDLLTVSQLTYLTALSGLVNVGSSISDDEEPGRPPRRGSRRKVTLPNRRKAKPVSSKKSLEEDDEEIDDEAEYEENADGSAFDLEDENEDEVTTKKKPDTKRKAKPASSKKTSSKKKTSLDSIMEEAENMEYEDEEDDIDFDDEEE